MKECKSLNIVSILHVPSSLYIITTCDLAACNAMRLLLFQKKTFIHVRNNNQKTLPGRLHHLVTSELKFMILTLNTTV